MKLKKSYEDKVSPSERNEGLLEVPAMNLRNCLLTYPALIHPEIKCYAVQITMPSVFWLAAFTKGLRSVK